MFEKILNKARKTNENNYSHQLELKKKKQTTNKKPPQFVSGLPVMPFFLHLSPNSDDRCRDFSVGGSIAHLRF